MPSASVKPAETIGAPDSKDPLHKVSLLMEKKIRNLEKRKNKLEHYKEELDQGKSLNEDQQHAIKAYDTVLASLDLCREFSTQICEVMTETVNLQKQQLKKQLEEKAHHEYERIKQVLKVQDILARLGQDEIRADFLAGNNGALRLSEEKLSDLDELYKLITPSGDDKVKANTQTFKTQLNTCAENMLTLLDGKNKPAGKSTYREMKSLIYQIANCSYPKSSSTSKENSSSHSSTPDSEEPQNIRKKSKKKKNHSGEEPASQEPQGASPAFSPAEPVEPPQNDMTATRDSSVSSSTTNGLSSSEKILTEPPALMEGPPPPGLVPHNVPPPAAAAVASTPAGSELRTPLVHMSPPSLNPSGPAQVAPPPQILSSQTYFNQSPVPPAQTQQLSQFSMDINDLVTSSRFNFLQESHVGQLPDQSSVYIDPAVVSFGSIKPESLIHLHEQQQQQQQQQRQQQQQTPPPPQSTHGKLSHSQPLHQGVGLSSSVEPPPHPGSLAAETFVNKNISSVGSTDYSQSVPLYSQSSSLVSASTTLPSDMNATQARDKSPPKQTSRIPDSVSWADPVPPHLSQSSQNELEDAWCDPVNGDVNDNDAIGWNDEPEDKSNFSSDFVSDSDRRNNYRVGRGAVGGMRGAGQPRGSGMGGPPGSYRGGRGSGFGYQGGSRGNSSSYGGNNFRGNRGSGGGPSGSGFRGRGSNPSRGGSSSNNRGYRGSGNRNSFQNATHSRGQF